MLHEFKDVIKISNFPKPYHSKYTPYRQDFMEFNYKTSISEESRNVNIAKVIVLGDIFVGKSSLVNR